jgi:murein L,D-transpeptidase YcbB/YkuD
VPQEIHDTFEAASQALAQGDYATYSRMLTPEAQERMAGNLAMTGAVLKQQVASTQALSALTEQFGGGDEEESAGAELERVVQVLEKHGVADIDPVSLLGSGGQASGSALVAASIEDKPAFIGEMLDAVMAVQAKAGLQTGQQIAPPAPGELTNVMVDGDTAAGLVAHTINGQERKTPITFRKVGDDWKIDESAH